MVIFWGNAIQFFHYFFILFNEQIHVLITVILFQRRTLPLDYTDPGLLKIEKQVNQYTLSELFEAFITASKMSTVNLSPQVLSQINHLLLHPR